MAQNYSYPSSSSVTITGNPNNAPIPSTSLLIAGENPAGNQTVVQTDATGNLIVSPLSASSTVTVVQPTGSLLHTTVDASALPAGASTSALQTSGNSSLTSILANQTNSTQITQISQATPGVTNGVVVTQPIPAGSSTIGFVNLGPDALLSPINITTQDLVTVTSTGANNQPIYTGTPTVGSVALFPLSSRAEVRIEVSGTWTGTVQSEISMDNGVTFYQNAVHQTGTPVTTFSFTGNFGGLLSAAGATHFRIRAVAPMTGTAVVTVLVSSNAGTVTVANSIKLVDSSKGSTNQMVMASASTAPIAAQAAMITVTSPNNPTYGTKAAGVAALQAELVGGVFNTTLPVLTTGQQASLQFDSSGRLITSPSSSTSTVTVVQPTAANLNATVTGTVTVVQPTAANLKATAFAGTPAPLTITQATLTVGLTAQRLTVSGSAPASTRVALVVTPDKSTTGLFYIGSSTVTTSSGIQIATGQVFIANNDAGDYWIISDTAAQAVGIMEQA